MTAPTQSTTAEVPARDDLEAVADSIFRSATAFDGFTAQMRRAFDLNAHERLALAALWAHGPLTMTDLGSWILERTWTKRDPRLWAALGRLGARVPAYASGGYYLDGKTPKKLGEELRGYVDAGFRAVKMKIANTTQPAIAALLRRKRAAGCIRPSLSADRSPNRARR